MQVQLSTPANLVGQSAGAVFDAPWLPRGNTPSGTLGSTLTADASLTAQAIKLGFAITGFIYG
jgi:hypothetical protein